MEAFLDSTKSRIRQIPSPGHRPGPAPLRSERELSDASLARVEADTADFLLAIQFVLQQRSWGAMRENPRRSLHWVDLVEIWMHQKGGWFDLDYDSCVLMAARKKARTIRHNLPELSSLPPLVCGHQHSPTEWKPQHSRGRAYVPSAEEAEHTAHLVFTLVAVASHWAISQGYAVARIQRLPPIETAGDRPPWLELPAAVFRSDAMTPLALFLGLFPPGASQARLPRRAVAADVLAKLPQNIQPSAAMCKVEVPFPSRSPWDTSQDCFPLPGVHAGLGAPAAVA